MTNIETRIDGSEKLTRIFGYWPSFHDAEVIELNFWRGDVNPEVERYIFSSPYREVPSVGDNQ